MVIRARSALATTLEHRIVSGAFVAGELRPSERMSSEAYGLRRSMVPEPPRMLAERRLIDVLPGRGSFVRGAHVVDAAHRLANVIDLRQVPA